MEFNAVLIMVYFIVSVFNVQLGQPVVMTLPYQSLEDCKAHADMIEGGQMQIDIEWMVYSRSQCMTRAEYEAMVAAQQQAMADQAQESQNEAVEQ